ETERRPAGLALQREVQGARIVNCLRSISGLTSIITLLRSPTKATVPHTLALRTAAMRPSGWLDVSSVKSAPPWVRSLIAPTGSFERGLTVSQAPNSLARSNRSGLCRRQADRPLAKQRDRVVARNVQPAQRAVGGAGAAGDRRSGGER